MPKIITLSNGQPKSKRQEEWAKWVKRWRESGLSQVAFCREASLSIHSFRFWNQRLGKKPRITKRNTKGPEFVPVRIKAGSNFPSATLELELPGQGILRIPSDCDRTLLADVMKILEKNRC